MSNSLSIAKIEIHRYFDENGADRIEVCAFDTEGDMPSLIEMLGMLELARDSIYRLAAGERDAESDEEEDNRHG